MRLIDADKLMECYDGLEKYHVPVGVVKANINDMPTIDAVPVVRCRDCQYYEQEQPGMVYCPAVVGGWVDNDWFCAGGERREIT